MQQPETQAPEDTGTEGIDGTTGKGSYGNSSAGERYQDGLGTTGTNTAPPVGEPLSHDAVQGPTGAGIVDTGVQGGEPVQNRTNPIQPHTEEK